MNNMARPRACFVLRMVCHERLTTKEKLCHMRMTSNDMYVFSSQRDIMDHLLFVCPNIMDHDPEEWENEIKWIIHASKGKGWRAQVLKTSFTKTIYDVGNTGMRSASIRRYIIER